jgi:biotin carboxyl carrier protein
MMTMDDIAQLLARLQRTDVTECEIQYGTQSLRVRFAEKKSQSQQPPLQTSAGEGFHAEPLTLTIAAPATGRFHATHPLAIPNQSDNLTLRRGDHIGYVEVDSVFCAVVAPKSGSLQSTLMQEGRVAGYGQAIAELKPLELPGDGNA